MSSIRESFEAWFQLENHLRDDETSWKARDSFDNENYSNPIIQKEWKIWKTACTVTYYNIIYETYEL
jgi:hypothetical protein